MVAKNGEKETLWNNGKNVPSMEEYADASGRGNSIVNIRGVKRSMDMIIIQHSGKESNGFLAAKAKG